VLRRALRQSGEELPRPHPDEHDERRHTAPDNEASERRHLRAAYQHGEEQVPRTKFQLAIEARAERRLIGNCGVRLAAPGSRVADVGYELAPDEWGHGYATEAARAIVAFGFDTLSLHRVAATCVADNAAAAHILEELGLRRVGHLREVAHYKGRWWDELVYGILEDEWRTRR